MKQITRIRVARGEGRFAAAHFLVNMGKCERLHGHNYQVTVELAGAPGPDGAVVDFNRLNPMVAALCGTLDHKILIAQGETRHELTIGETEIEARFKGKRYLFPREDCLLLPIANSTVESLSAWLLDNLACGLAGEGAALDWIEVGVSEGENQMAITRRELS